MKYFFCPNFQICQLLINSPILKHEVTRNSLMITRIYIMLFIPHNNLLFMHLLTKDYNFISILKNVGNSLPIYFEIWSNFQQIKTFGDALAPPAPPVPTPLDIMHC